jgi:hypothetical protein
MERVAFLLEHTGERIGCLLNPESLVVRRTAGVRSRTTTGGSLSGAGLADDPLIYTGGGYTDLLLDLLFDTRLAGSSLSTDDVRTLTRPLFELAEGDRNADGFTRPPSVRFVWGKSWNISGVVTSVAERVEEFTASGAPQRSWLRMRLVRVSEQASTLPPRIAPGIGIRGSVFEEARHDLSSAGVRASTSLRSESTRVSTVASGERLDEIAWKHYGDSRLWRLIAYGNAIANPFAMTAGLALTIPPLSSHIVSAKTERSK